MSITKVGSVPSTEKNKYRFDTYIEGQRHQSIVSCWPSEVKKRYKAWEALLVTQAEKANAPWLFEKLDEYLEYSKQIKSNAQHKHETTVVNRAVKVFFKDTPLHEVTRAHIEAFVAWRRSQCFYEVRHRSTVTESTVNHALSVLNYFFNWARIRGYYMSLNPCFKTKLKEHNIREVRLTKEQLDELLTKAAERDVRLYWVIVICLSTGLRYGEVMGLEWHEVDFDRSLICLSRLKTKSKKARIVPIINPLREMLLAMRNASGIGGKVIGSSYNAIRLLWKRFRPSLSFTTESDGPLRLHDLRHCTAQYLLDSGVALEDIQVVLGHQDYATTQRRYAMFARPDLAEKMACLENIIPFSIATG